jgi:hypothetical protein
MTGRLNASLRIATFAAAAASLAAPFAPTATAKPAKAASPLTERERLRQSLAGMRVTQRRQFSARLAVPSSSGGFGAVNRDSDVGLRIGEWTFVKPLSSDRRWKPGKTSATFRVRSPDRRGATTVRADWRGGVLRVWAKSTIATPLADEVGRAPAGPLSVAVDAAACLGDQVVRLRGAGTGAAVGGFDPRIDESGAQRVDLAATADVVVDAEDLKAPRVEISSPTAQSTHSEDSVTVSGVVVDDRDVASVSWTIDGGAPTNAPFAVDRSSGPLDDVRATFLFAVPAAVGAHTVSVFAADAAGNVGSSYVVYARVAPDATPPVVTPPVTPPTTTPPEPIGRSPLRTAKWGATFVDSQGRAEIWGYGTKSPTLAPNVPAVVVADGNLGVRADGTVMKLHGEGTVGDPSVVNGLTNIVDATTTSNGCSYFAVRGDGTVWVWGQNSTGVLGDGTTTDRATPIQLTGLPAIQSVSAGAQHAVALDKQGGVWMWGNANSLGTWSLTPQQVPGIAHATKAVASQFDRYDVGAAVLEDGTLWMWGDALSGQLGSSTGSRTTAPFQVAGVGGVKSVALGYNHVLVLMSDGTVLARGGPTSQVYGYWGELGDGTMTPHLAFAPVPGLTNVVQVAAGAHTSHALLADGTIRAWGQNTYGTLGDGTTTDRSSPVVVTPAQ